MNSWLDKLLGVEQPVSVMQPGPVRTTRTDGLLGAIAEPVSYAPGPMGMLGTAASAYARGGVEGVASAASDITMSMFGGKAGPMMRKIAAGENATKIPKNATHWMGPEGRMRWELSDRNAGMVKPINEFPTGAMIDRVVKHDELFKQYPELKGYRILPLKAKQGTEESKAWGSHDGKNKIIYVNPKLTKDEQMSTILHELQHGVQNVEGHVSGASGTAAGHLAINIIEQYKNATADKQRLLRAQVKEAFGVDLDKDGIVKLKDQIYRKKYGEVEARTTQERYKQTKQMTDDEMYEMYGTFQDTLGMEDATPVLWQDTWKKLFGTRELPPFVNLEKGNTIPITDF